MGKKRKAKPPLEMVVKCDSCGIPLHRTCVRTDGSAVCAAGVGIVAQRFPSGYIGFYCSLKCRTDASKKRIES